MNAAKESGETIILPQDTFINNIISFLNNIKDVLNLLSTHKFYNNLYVPAVKSWVLNHCAPYFLTTVWKYLKAFEAPQENIIAVLKSFGNAIKECKLDTIKGRELYDHCILSLCPSEKNLFVFCYKSGYVFQYSTKPPYKRIQEWYIGRSDVSLATMTAFDNSVVVVVVPTTKEQKEKEKMREYVVVTIIPTKENLSSRTISSSLHPIILSEGQIGTYDKDKNPSFLIKTERETVIYGNSKYVVCCSFLSHEITVTIYQNSFYTPEYIIMVPNNTKRQYGLSTKSDVLCDMKIIDGVWVLVFVIESKLYYVSLIGQPHEYNIEETDLKFDSRFTFTRIESVILQPKRIIFVLAEGVVEFLSVPISNKFQLPIALAAPLPISNVAVSSLDDSIFYCTRNSSTSCLLVSNYLKNYPSKEELENDKVNALIFEATQKISSLYRYLYSCIEYEQVRVFVHKVQEFKIWKSEHIDASSNPRISSSVFIKRVANDFENICYAFQSFDSSSSKLKLTEIHSWLSTLNNILGENFCPKFPLRKIIATLIQNHTTEFQVKALENWIKEHTNSPNVDFKQLCKNVNLARSMSVSKSNLNLLNDLETMEKQSFERFSNQLLVVVSNDVWTNVLNSTKDLQHELLQHLFNLVSSLQFRQLSAQVSTTVSSFLTQIQFGDLAPSNSKLVETILLKLGAFQNRELVESPDFNLLVQQFIKSVNNCTAYTTKVEMETDSDE